MHRARPLRFVTLVSLVVLAIACRQDVSADDTAPEAKAPKARAKSAPAAKPPQPAAATTPAATTAPTVATAGPTAAELVAGDFKTTASGLKYRDITVGTGAEVKEGFAAGVHYTGWLTDGTKFDSSLDRGRPFTVAPVGRAGVIKGWNEGLLGMKVGGKRRLVIPPDLAYGPGGRGQIPPNATLVFDVEVLSAEPGPPPPTPQPPMTFPDTAKLELTTKEGGLQVHDLKVGAGAEVKDGSNADVHYTGWLTNGTKFDSSLERGQPFPVRGIPRAGVIKGWNEGLLGMKEGGERVLVIPAAMAYGERGYPPVIPPGSTLIFQVRVVKVTSPAG